VTADIAGDFAAAGGMPDVDDMLQVELGDQFIEVVGIGVHVVAVPGLAGAAVTATVVGDATIAAGGEEEHLILEGVGGEGPAVAEDDGRAVAPVVVIDLGAVLGGECAHGAFPWYESWGAEAAVRSVVAGIVNAIRPRSLLERQM
jgi:hypothetical protein